VERLQEVDWVISNGEPSGLVESESVMRMHADGFINLASGEQLTCAAFCGRYSQVHAVCGIGNPRRFFESLHELGISTIKHTYSDHYDFAGPEVRFGDGMQVVCTEKDAAKLKHLEDDFSHVWFLRVSVQLETNARDILVGLLEARAIAPQRLAREDEIGEMQDLEVTP
jgi:tetraacyldisaccharide 4'-kinase